MRQSGRVTERANGATGAPGCGFAARSAARAGSAGCCAGAQGLSATRHSGTADVWRKDRRWTTQSSWTSNGILRRNRSTRTSYLSLTWLTFLVSHSLRSGLSPTQSAGETASCWFLPTLSHQSGCPRARCLKSWKRSSEHGMPTSPRSRRQNERNSRRTKSHRQPASVPDAPCLLGSRNGAGRLNGRRVTWEVARSPRKSALGCLRHCLTNLFSSIDSSCREVPAW